MTYLSRIVGTALKIVASGNILSHIHSTESIQSLACEIDLLRNIKEGGQLMDITLHDHIIVTPTKDRYYGFADEGRI